MYKSSLELIRHIEQEADFILRATHSKRDSEFYSDEVLTRAVVRALEVIGEASKKLDLEFKSNHPEVEWKKIARLRDKLIHHYKGIDYTIVWEIIQDDIPELYFQVIDILKNNTDDTL